MSSEKRQVYCVVKLDKFNQHTVVPANWIKDYGHAKTMNYGLNSYQPHLMFWSEDFDTYPDFNTEIGNEFPPNPLKDACYQVHCKKSFGE